MSSELSASRKLYEEATNKLAESQQFAGSTEAALGHERDLYKTLSEKLEQSLASVRQLEKELQDYLSMKGENKRLELEVLRLDAALRVCSSRAQNLQFFTRIIKVFLRYNCCHLSRW